MDQAACSLARPKFPPPPGPAPQTSCRERLPLDNSPSPASRACYRLPTTLDRALPTPNSQVSVTAEVSRAAFLAVRTEHCTLRDTQADSLQEKKQRNCSRWRLDSEILSANVPMWRKIPALCLSLRRTRCSMLAHERKARQQTQTVESLGNPDFFFEHTKAGSRGDSYNKRSSE